MRLMAFVLLMMPSTRLAPSGQRQWARMLGRHGRGRWAKRIRGEMELPSDQWH